LAHQAEQKGLRLDMHIDPHTPYRIRGDEVRLRQILINLLNNAIKFTEKGHVEVRVEPCPGLDGRTWLRFEVVDTGIGIPDEVQAHIFEVFTQADGTITRRYGGTGLGTAISKQLVDLLGGWMEVESQPGTGTLFRVTLPWDPPEEESEPGALGSGGKVLLLTRDRVLSKTLLDWFRVWGLEGEIVFSQDAILAWIGSHNDQIRGVIADEGELLDPTGFLSCFGSPGPQARPGLILLRRDPESRRLKGLESYFDSILDLPPDKPLLFNALYALPADLPQDERVVDLAEKRAKRGEQENRGYILVAEDNATNQEVIGLILEKGGYRSRMAADGEEALRALEEETFDLAILDMHMPERSGTEVIKLYRFMELGQAPMPFVLLTANVTSDAVREAEDAGVAAYLTKPVEARRLLETLERVLLAEQAAGEDLAPEGDEPATERRGAGHDPRSTPDGYLVSGQTMKELARMSQDPAFLSNLIQGFLRDSEKLLGAMETAAEECRLEDLRGNAHTL
ncbi:MAG TPA: ATP-binding protein, partial [Gammaproteobacteria bacterium]|nr:ATP-binding protein [Gammaproteobacteria bacterium]